MTLSEVTQLVQSSRTLLHDLDPAVANTVAAGLDVAANIAGVVSDARAELLRTHVEKTRQIVDALGDALRVTMEEREQYANDQIQGFEEALQSASGTEQIIVQGKLRQAKINKTVLLAAGVFQGFVVFSTEEREEINQLMRAAEEDLAKRRELAAAIRISVSVLKTGLSIAQKIALA